MGTIKLSRKALKNNIDVIASKVGDVSKIAAVLKDNAYGHGSVLLAKELSSLGVKHAVVRTESEAYEIIEFFETILVLADIASVAHPKISYAINSLDLIAKFPPYTKVELKVDSGMHRNGVSVSELEMAFTMMREANLECVGVFTHHRASDTLSSEWFWQRKNFDNIKMISQELSKKYGYNPRFHLSNSAAIFRDGTHSEDIVRAGIAIYGCLEMDSSLEQPQLQPVLSLWGEKIASRVLKAGERVGYNGTYTATDDEVVSTYDLGYANGLDRLASNNYTTPDGYRLLGRISMDNATFNTDCDELLVFDNANRYATSVGTIGYEILACLDSKLSRVWTD